MISLSAKTKGGGAGLVTKWGENGLFWGDRNFLPMGWPDENKLFVWPRSSRIFYLNQKQKKLCYFKVGQFEIFKKHGCPSFETNATVRNTFTWDGYEEISDKVQRPKINAPMK